MEGRGCACGDGEKGALPPAGPPAPHSQAKQRRRASTSMQMRLLACCRVSGVAVSGKRVEPRRAERRGRRRRRAPDALASRQSRGDTETPRMADDAAARKADDAP